MTECEIQALPASVRVADIPVHAFSCKSLAGRFKADCVLKGTIPPKLVFSMNGEGISRYHSDPLFRTAIDQADYIHADGMSVVRAGNRYGHVFPERVATTDAFHDVARLAEREGLSFYFLGAKAEINQLTVENVQRLYPKLRIVGSHHGYFHDGSEQERYIIEEIAKLKPDVVWVALGRPRQELWCVRNADKLVGVVWLKTCGGLFDFLSGKSKRAPDFMIRWGLEWLYRLSREPRRLFKRYLVTNIHAMYLYRKYRFKPEG